ncbi:hypothetical protein N9241_00890, partial [bacterium]|nr:hypothetical protein [bacterium]
WEVIWKDEAPRNFLEQIISDVAWLQSEKSLIDNAGTSSLDQIDDFLDNCKSWGKAEKVAYYEMNHLKERHNFPNFIRKQARDHFVYSNWTLEIVSPFFAEDPDNREHEFFFDLGVQEIHLLLPRDQEGTALCQPEYFERINDEDYIHWARWRDEVATGLGTKGQHFRRLHAKIYHFYNRKQSWAFVGSVNFSHKAMWDNNEAGFFTQLNKAGPLLEVIQRTSSVDTFEPPTELMPGLADDIDQDATLPRITLAYDWSEKRLQAVCEKHHSYTIVIFTPEGTEAVSLFSITGTPRTWEGEISSLESLLRNGSLVKVGGINSRSGEPFPTHQVMLQQTGWTHKPMDAPDLTPAQILAIYADLSPERREQVAYNEMIRKLIDLGEAGDLTGPTDELIVKQFFSEYAEIFHAFRRLQTRLVDAIEAENTKLADYYLSGTGMDSLPTLLDHLESEKSTIDGVTKYLVLLCTQEIYRSPQAKMSKHVKQQLKRVRLAIKDIKAGEAIKLQRGTPAGRKTFFEWFEGQFYKQYRLKEAAE